MKVRVKIRFRVQKNSGLGLLRHSVNGIGTHTQSSNMIICDNNFDGNSSS